MLQNKYSKLGSDTLLYTTENYTSEYTDKA